MAAIKISEGTIITDCKGNSYRIGFCLGHGGFGSVYHGCVITSNNGDVGGKEVAIKALSKRDMAKRKMYQRVREEYSIHSRLEHPSIVGFYNCFEDEHILYFILEYCSKGDLARQMKLLEGNRMDEKTAGNIIQQILDGLLYLHRHQIMHRDLTLTNILITSDNRYKIGDFGLATQIKPLQDCHKTMCGTPVAMSPEVVMRSPHGLKADVWGLGCIFYTILVGKSPFETNELQKTLTRVVIENPCMPQYLSPEAYDLIERMLRKNPLDRIDLASIRQHPFMLKLYKISSADSGIVYTLTSSASNQYNSLPMVSHVISNHDSHSKVGAKLTPTRSLPDFQGFPTPPSSVRNHQSSMFIQQLPPPLRTDRLLPTIQTLEFRKNQRASAQIKTNGEVCLDYYDPITTLRICSLTFSQDGLSITVRRNNCGESVEHYSYKNLPRSLWNKYTCAARFVAIVASKTPKIKWFSSRAKFVLMENSTNFEAIFYDGTKMQTVLSSSGKFVGSNDDDNDGDKEAEKIITVIDKTTGKCHQLTSINPMCYDKYLTHFHEGRNFCLRLESINSNLNAFPLCVGRRKVLQPILSLRKHFHPTNDSGDQCFEFVDNSRLIVSPDDQLSLTNGDGSVVYVGPGHIPSGQLPDEVFLRLAIVRDYYKSGSTFGVR